MSALIQPVRLGVWSQRSALPKLSQTSVANRGLLAPGVAIRRLVSSLSPLLLFAPEPAADAANNPRLSRSPCLPRQTNHPPHSSNVSRMLRWPMFVCLAAGLIATDAFAQQSPASPASNPVPTVQAVRATSAVVIDGRLDDEVWLKAPAVTSFTQRDPEEGKPVSERTELRLAYDEAALYVGARMFDREASKIARQLARRDSQGEADAFWLFLDPHHDHLTGAAFSVSAAGVQSDSTIYNDTWQDGSWDAVWLSDVKIDDQGWTAEMRIPYSQLRFPSAARHTFGINAMRFIQRKKEEAWLVHVPKKESGLASRLGHLEGLEGISPHRTVELLPYVVSRAEFVAPDSDRDPFNDGARMFAGTGIDLKYRLSSNLSLDGTINPDFGQVEVDPAVVNLTAFETFFEEKRPFFIEGANIFSNFGRTGANDFWGFNRAEPMIFYSRRIGRSPQGPTDGEFVDTPTATTILGAAKLTGKTRRGWTVGLLDAVTGRETATEQTNDLRSEIEVEPLTNYMVGRAQREIGRGAVGMLATAVNRDLRTPALQSYLPAQAYVGGLDGHYFLDKKTRLGGRRTNRRQPPDRRSRGDLAAAALVAAVVQPAGCHARGVRSNGHVARRVDRQREPESAERCARLQHRAVVREPGLRFERCGLQFRERSRRHARGLPLPRIRRSIGFHAPASSPWPSRTRGISRAKCSTMASSRLGTPSSRITGRSSRRWACSERCRTIALHAGDRRCCHHAPGSSVWAWGATIASASLSV